MRVAWFDCFSGISGDMTLGALLACGVDEEHLRGELGKLRMSGWQLDIAPTSQNGIGATDVTVTLTEEQGHGRHLHHIQGILDASDLSQSIRDKAIAVFTKLAEAEATIHQTTVERIHFHEVGAVDAIVDIVGACVALEALGIDEVICAPLPMSRGFVECMHGTIPLPAPATLELLQGVPVYSVDIEGELVTPTGAALMTTLASRFGPMPAMKIATSGYGAGKKQFGNRPNLLRVIIGETVDDAFTGAPEVAVLETNIDDLSPQFYEPLSERLMAAGAADVYLSPIQMKKGRPATLLSVLAPPDLADALAEILFTETTTLGIRYNTMRRLCLDREWRTVETPYGPIRIKIGSWRGTEKTASPEYEDVKAAAEKHNAPLKAVHQAALSAYNPSH
jgi:pyridinium-3,5-bisthiocarboxylic acid mononucleotide nickel chelatase